MARRKEKRAAARAEEVEEGEEEECEGWCGKRVVESKDGCRQALGIWGAGGFGDTVNTVE